MIAIVSIAFVMGLLIGGFAIAAFLTPDIHDLKKKVEQFEREGAKAEFKRITGMYICTNNEWVPGKFVIANEQEHNHDTQ